MTESTTSITRAPEARPRKALPKMPYVRLGNSGLKVSRSIIGSSSTFTNQDKSKLVSFLGF